MAVSAVVKLTCFLIGAVIGGGIVFGIVKLVDRDSGSNDNATNATGTRVNDSLQFVVVVSRHGNRGAETDYANDPYPLNSTKYWPYGINALTPFGRKQEYKLGKKVRSLYNGFLPTTFVSEDIYACSDLYERVVMSGDLFLAGLYPPEGFQVWNKNIDWQPIALYTNSSDRSLVIDYCPRYEVEKENSLNAFVKEDAANISTIWNHFYKLSNENYTVSQLFYIFEKVISEVTEGYPLPDIINDIYPQPFTDFYRKQFMARYAGTDEVSRLWVGNLLGEIVDTMGSKVNGTSGRKISYYSGHDVTIVNLEVALGVPRSSLISLVKPGSALIVELHKDPNTSDHTVQVLLIDGSLDDLEPVSLPLTTCGSPCMFDAFVNTTSNYTNVNYDDECQVTAIKYSGKPSF